jgi:APA family basic amino acid/polyamine antiporter
LTETLRRTLGARDVLFIVVGNVIGSGIFIVPAETFRQAHTVKLALGIWVIGGVLSLLGALTYGELSSMRPESGGLYSYIRDAFGVLPAFLYGWTVFAVIGTGTLAALAVAFTRYVQQLTPLGPAWIRVVTLAFIAALAAINVRGTRASAGMQNGTTALKVGILVALSIGLCVAGQVRLALHTTASSATGPASLRASIGPALVGVLWAYEGWQYGTFAAGETRDAPRVVPRALAAGTIVVIIVYLLVNLGYVAALGLDRAARSPRIAAEATSAAFGPVAGQLLAVVALVAIFSSANANVLTSTRLYFSMARDGMFFDLMGRVHGRFGTPAIAIIASSVWAAVLAMSGTFEQLLLYVIFVGWAFYGLGAASLVVLRRREPARPGAFRAPGYPATPVIFVLAALAVVLDTVGRQPARAAAGASLVLAGIPAYFIWRARSRTASLTRATRQDP